MKPDHPEMLSLRSRIDELDRQISREGANVASGRSNTLARRISRRAGGRKRAAGPGRRSCKGSVLDLRGRSIQYKILQREVDTNRSLYDALLQRYKEIGVAGGIGTIAGVDRRSGADSRRSLHAEPAAEPAHRTRVRACWPASAARSASNSSTTRSRRATTCATSSALACLGAVPKTALPRARFVEDLKDPDRRSCPRPIRQWSPRSASAPKPGPPRSLLVTSTRAAEGKSSSALALAQNFARRGKSVLLIDGDLRKPAFKAGDGQGRPDQAC